ncbi:unnamed protein product [Sphenostylis stenocarpa]|uniref:Uncharacterized protein n=1 Tax=Sphenostylis stenocarpa TaxID=92480 RepID=A0AA86SEY2_9FABA|nr:unnamed protein product [Sphenostylis stenocarpa]
MVALKKAYADVILNTVKESAGRVMVSERRAVMFQQELTSAKENALHMLMRLKKMMDAKALLAVAKWISAVAVVDQIAAITGAITADAEKASLQQQRKIEELEAQLSEAEDVVTDLRAELKHVYLVLEKTRNNQVQPLNGQNVKQVATFVAVKPEISISPPHKELECVTSCDVVNKSLAMNILDNNCCNSKQQTEQLLISNLEDSSGHDSYLSSVIKRNMKPELCRNGFTQRIRALEGSLLDEKLLMQDVDNQHYGKKLGVIAKDSDVQVAKCSAPTEKMEIKKHVKLLEIPKWKIISCHRCRILACKLSKDACSLPSIKLSAISKWKRKRRHRHLGMKSSAFRSCKPSFVLKQCSSVCDNAKCCEDEYDANMKSVPLLTNVEPVHGATELVEKPIDKDTNLLKSEESATQNLTGPSSDMKVEVIDVPSTNTDMKDAKAFVEKDRSPSKVDDSKPLKYTFQRKRRKESLGNTHQNIDSKRSTVKRRVDNKQYSALEPQNLA